MRNFRRIFGVLRAAQALSDSAMQLKTNLHFHTGDDPHDFVPYSTEEGIDCAASLGFDALAITCHNKAAWTSAHAAYAAERGMLLIPGIELDVHERDGSTGRRGRHLIILNCRKEAERVRTFADLHDYRRAHPEAFVLAPHPYSYGNFSLKKFLEKHIALVDAIEHTWFHSQRFNRNKKAAYTAVRHRLPMIVTSDAHTFRNLDTDYALVDAEEKTIPALFDAIRAFRVQNLTQPKKLVREMALPGAKLVSKNFLYRRGWRNPAGQSRLRRPPSPRIASHA